MNSIKIRPEECLTDEERKIFEDAEFFMIWLYNRRFMTAGERRRVYERIMKARLKITNKRFDGQMEALHGR